MRRGGGFICVWSGCDTYPEEALFGFRLLALSGESGRLHAPQQRPQLGMKEGSCLRLGIFLWGRFILRPQEGEENHFLDAGGIGQQHGQPVNPQP